MFGSGYIVPPSWTDKEREQVFYKPHELFLDPNNADAVDALKNYASQLDAENQELYKTLVATYTAYKDAWMKYFLTGKKEDKKILNAFDLIIPMRPQSNLRMIEDQQTYLVRQHEEALKEQVKKERQLASEKELLRKQAAAIEFIQKSEGYQVNTKEGKIYYTAPHTRGMTVSEISAAITIANEIKFKQLQHDALDEYEDEATVEIDCCEYCNDWDPSSNRCSCGNRRISWSYTGDFEDMIIYPEAY
jgi:hypothetical protein